MYRNGKTFSGTNGRAKLINDTEKKILLDGLAGSIATRAEHFQEKMITAINNTRISRGQSTSLTKIPHRSTIKKFIDDNNLEARNVEEITDARYKAVYDVYNAITFAAMNHVIVPQC